MYAGCQLCLQADRQACEAETEAAEVYLYMHNEPGVLCVCCRCTTGWRSTV